MSKHSGKDLPIKVRDVRWTQEFLYPSFSNGVLTVAETYVLLALGILDPASLSPLVIFKNDQRYWCCDTRRLMIAQALEAGGFPAYQNMQFTLVTVHDKKYEKQYQNLIYERFPAMERKKIDGTTIKISTRKGPTCCFDMEQHKFREDLFQHVPLDHLKCDVNFLHDINSFYCNDCEAETELQITRLPNKKTRKYYQIIRQCQCDTIKGVWIASPWQKVSLMRICQELNDYRNQHDILRTRSHPGDGSYYQTEVSSDYDAD